MELVKSSAQQVWDQECVWRWRFAFTRTHVSTLPDGRNLYVWFKFYETRVVDGTYVMGTWRRAYRYKNYPELELLEGTD